MNEDIKGLVADCSYINKHSINKAIFHWHDGISNIMKEHDLTSQEVLRFVEGLSFHGFIREYYATNTVPR